MLRPGVNFARLVVVLVISGWLGSSAAYAGPIIDGREWFQPADVGLFTWAQYDATCTVANGRVCTGQVGGTGPDLT